MPDLIERRAYWQARALAHRGRRWFDVPRRAASGSWRGLRGFLYFGRQLGSESFVVIILAAAIVLPLELLAEWTRASPAVTGMLADPGQAYRDLRTLLATVAGIVLGLYFTALATVLQSRYDRVPAPVASLLARDRVGGQYVRVLAVAISLSIAEMILEGVGRAPTRWHLLALGLVAIFALVGFANLGRRAFSFLDPARLMDTIVDDLYVAIRSVIEGGRDWTDPARQVIARQRADEALDVAQMIVELSREAPNTSARESSRRLHHQLALTLSTYVQAKTAIPTDSKWFGAVAHHRQWYQAGTTELGLAIDTQTTLRPDLQPDSDWLERRVFGLLLDTADHHSTMGSHRELAAVLGMIGDCLYFVGASLQVESGLAWVARTEHAVEASVGVRTEGTKEVREQIAHCVDLAALARIQLMLGFGARVRSIDAARLQRAVTVADWRKAQTPERLGLWDPVRRTAERLREQVAFEAAAEAARVTPDWFITEQLALEFARALQPAATALATATRTPPLLSAGDDTEVVLAGLRASRRLEECAKLDALLPTINKLQSDLKALDRSHDYIWPRWSGDEVQAAVDEAAAAARRAFARLIVPLSRVRDTGDIPDLLGEAVSKTGEAAVRAVIRSDHIEFTEIYPSYFFGCLAVTELLLKRPPSVDPARDAVLNTEALIDLAAVSGYALLFSELTGLGEGWTLVDSLWRPWLAEVPGRLDLVVAAIQLRTGLYGLTPRSILRTSWEQGVAADLQRRREMGENLGKASSALVRAVSRSSFGLFMDGSRIFTSRYLRTLPGADAIDFGPDHIADAIAHEARRKERRSRSGRPQEPPESPSQPMGGSDADGAWLEDEGEVDGGEEADG